MKPNKRIYENTGKTIEKYNVINKALTADSGDPAQEGWLEADVCLFY